jgi:hypothetical protein
MKQAKPGQDAHHNADNCRDGRCVQRQGDTSTPDDAVPVRTAEDVVNTHTTPR